MASNPDNRRALVTGATGFVGSHLVKHLTHAGWDVGIIVLPGSSLQPLGDARHRVSVFPHDGTMAGMQDIAASFQPDVAFHLASLFLSQHRTEDVDQLLTSNVLFATQLVEALTATTCTRFVNIGTSWQYFEGNDYNPVNLYAATKQAFDDILRYYLEATPLKAITLTFFDTYGPDDPRRKLISLLHDAAESGSRLQMSPGEQRIDLVHVDDVVAAMIRAATLLETQECALARYGVSSGRAPSLKDLVALIERIVGKPLNIEWGGRPYRPREVMQPTCPYPTLPGWQPQVGLEHGLRQTMGLPGDH